MKLEETFVVLRPCDALLPVLDRNETFTALLPRTRIESHTANRRETVTVYTAMGQTRDIRFTFETLPGGLLRFEKICDGNVWRALRGEIRLEAEGDRSTRVVLQMEGQTRALIPEFTILAPMRQQLDEMARALRELFEVD